MAHLQCWALVSQISHRQWNSPGKGGKFVEEEGTSRTAPGLRPASLADHVEQVHDPTIRHGQVQGSNQMSSPLSLACVEQL